MGVVSSSGIDVFSLTLGHFFNGPADFIKRKARVSIQRQTGQDSFFFIPGVTNNTKLVVDGLDTNGLQIVLEKLVDKGGFTG